MVTNVKGKAGSQGSSNLGGEADRGFCCLMASFVETAEWLMTEENMHKHATDSASARSVFGKALPLNKAIPNKIEYPSHSRYRMLVQTKSKHAGGRWTVPRHIP
jgi:hypothetical protein